MVGLDCTMVMTQCGGEGEEVSSSMGRVQNAEPSYASGRATEEGGVMEGQFLQAVLTQPYVHCLVSYCLKLANKIRHILEQ